MVALVRGWNSPPGGATGLPLLRLPASLLTIAFTGQCLLDTELLAWLQIERVPFDLSDDVLLQNLFLEAAERVLHRLAVLEHYLSQLSPQIGRASCRERGWI